MSLFRLRRLRSLGGADLRRLVLAQAALVWAAVLVRTRPAGRLISTGAAASPAEPVQPGSAVLAEAGDLAIAVERAATYGIFRPSCLVRSVALQRLLRARGIRDSRIHIGVRMQKGEFLAHAWIEWQGQVLGDRPRHVQTFAPLCDVQLATRR